MRRGWSLIETLMAMALTAFLISGAAELMIRSAQLKEKADILTAAAGLARDRLAELSAQVFDGNLGEEGLHEEVEFDKATGRRFRVAWRVEHRPRGVKAVSITVSPEQSSHKGIELRCLLSPSLGF